MGKYRKKPVVVEAVRYDGTVESYSDCCGMVPGTNLELRAGGGFEVPTLEGAMLCRVGDWLIRGVKGELYPCKPDVFAATYEPAR